MEKHIIFLICSILFAAATLTVAKSYRNDYVYNSHTDAFYKIHITAHSHLPREKVCEMEGAKLMPPMSKQELSQVHAAMNQNQFEYTEANDDRQQHDSAEGQTIIDLESEAKDVLELNCQATTRDGFVQSRSIVPDQPYVCKVKAMDVPYDPQCRVHTRGYRFIPSIGSCYKIPRVALMWRQAAAECQAQGAHLAVINSDLESLVLKNISTPAKHVLDAANGHFFFIGLRAVKLTEPRVFKTIFNQTLEEAGFGTWLAGEPNNINGVEHCGTMHITGTLNDSPCGFRMGFICEKEVI